MSLRRTVGWTAVGVSTVFSSFWAFWGSIEAFHEGWFSGTWTGNVLGAVAYLSPMLALMTPALAAVRWAAHLRCPACGRCRRRHVDL